MIVTYRDKLGMVSVKIDDEYGVIFDSYFAHFIDEDDTYYKIETKYIISIVKEN